MSERASLRARRKTGAVFMNLEQKAEKLIDKYKMISAGDKIVAAFSGGSDSSALLHFLITRYGRENIYAAHLNHLIRGSDAYADENFAVMICGGYNIKIFTERRDIPGIAKKLKKSAEEAGRDERYDFFRRVCAEIGGTEIGGSEENAGNNIKVATAHTAPDNTESVIMNLARGTGVDGLCGIAPVAAGNIIRPLLSCEKRDILEYCRENNIKFTEDRTNTDEKYIRNFIRHGIASKIKERYAGLDANILNMSDIMRDTADFIDLQAGDILKDGDNNENGLPVGVYTALHKTLRRAVIIKMCKTAGGRLDFRLVEEIDKALLEGKLVRKDLPGNTAAEVSGGRLRIYREEKNYRIYRKEIKEINKNRGKSGNNLQ